MSGGSYNYTCYRVEEEYVGRMFDPELGEMMNDLCEVLHDLEWWQSSDIGEEQYRETVQKFKDKWFGHRDERLRELVKSELAKVQETIEKI
jgi:hypothetical protein